MKISTIVAGLLAVGVLAGASSAMAQEKMNLGVDAAFLMPIGKWGDVTGPMIGGLLRFEYPMQPGLVLTARAGYLFGLNKTQACGGGDCKSSVSNIPIWGGVKYYFGGTQEGLYGAAELGLNMLTVKVDIPVVNSGFGSFGGETSSSETKFGTNLGAGYKTGPIDFRAALSILDLGEAGDSMGVLATVGYNFAQF